MKSKKSRQHEDMKWIPKIKAPSKHKTKTEKSGQHQDTKQTQKKNPFPSRLYACHLGVDCV